MSTTTYELKRFVDDLRRITAQHSDPRDRVYSGTNAIHAGGAFDSCLLLPIIPER